MASLEDDDITDSESLARLNEELNTCSLCDELWEDCGSHGTVTLSCGDLFGMSCILNHFDQGGTTCPLCKEPSRKEDIRRLVLNLSRNGNESLTQLNTQYELVQPEYTLVRNELNKLWERSQELEDQINALEVKQRRLKHRLTNLSR